jgi:hypothetical protein
LQLAFPERAKPRRENREQGKGSRFVCCSQVAFSWLKSVEKGGRRLAGLIFGEGWNSACASDRFPKRECVPIWELRGYICFVAFTRDRVISRFQIGNGVPERNPAALLVNGLLSATYNYCSSLALNLIIEKMPASSNQERNRLYL